MSCLAANAGLRYPYIMALHPRLDEERPRPQRPIQRRTLRAPESASGGLRRSAYLRARRSGPQSLTASGENRPRYDRMRRRALLPQSTVSEVVVTANRLLQKIWNNLTSPCAQVLDEPGPVFVDFVGGDAIAGYGVTGSIGVFKNFKTGSGGFFVTGGGGVGASFGATIQGGFYSSAADLQGLNVNVGAAVPPASGTLNFSPDGRLVGATVGPGAKLGVSGTVTNTTFVGCSIGGH